MSAVIWVLEAFGRTSILVGVLGLVGQPLPRGRAAVYWILVGVVCAAVAGGMVRL